MQYSFDVQEAVDFGVDEAIMIWNLRFWILKNKANSKHLHEGRTWTYNTNEAFQQLFPFWKKGSIERLLGRMFEKNIIIKGNFNVNKYDRTSWYAFFDESKFLAPHLVIAHFSETGNGFPENKKSTSQNLEMDLAETGNGFSGNGKYNTDIKPDIKPNLCNKYSSNSSSPPPLEFFKKLKEEGNFRSDEKKYYENRTLANWKNGKQKIENFGADFLRWENGYLEKNPVVEKKSPTRTIDLEEIKKEKEINELRSKIKFLLHNAGYEYASQQINPAPIKRTETGFKILVEDERILKFKEVLEKINVTIEKV